MSEIHSRKTHVDLTHRQTLKVEEMPLALTHNNPKYLE